MPTKAPRPCLVCRRLTSHGSRCETHSTTYDTPTYRVRRAALLDAWRIDNGPWCPGADDLDHSPHPVQWPDHLTIDHIIPLSRGGTHHTENLRVLCNQANQAHGQR